MGVCGVWDVEAVGIVGENVGVGRDVGHDARDLNAKIRVLEESARLERGGGKLEATVRVGGQSGRGRRQAKFLPISADRDDWRRKVRYRA